MKPHAPIALVLLLVSTTLGAGPGRATEIPIAAGTPVRVLRHDTGGFQLGTLERASTDSSWIAWRGEAGASAHANATLAGLQYASGSRRSSRKGAAIGIVLGGAAGGVIGGLVHGGGGEGGGSGGGGEGEGGIARAVTATPGIVSSRTPVGGEIGEGMVLGALVGGIVGALTGAGLHERVWIDLPLSSVRVTIGTHRGAFAIALGQHRR